ncbi:MAG: HlyD family type I secretion periplasmic adaptor subunit [Burkholderiales bacterium]
MIPAKAPHAPPAQAAGHDFAPAILALQAEPPSPLPRAVLWLVLGFLAALGLWAVYGRLDVVATAEGRLVPAAQLKIVQPAEGGILRALLVREGDRVTAGQLLARMDIHAAEADARSVGAELALRRLQLRRIEAELAGVPLAPREGDPAELYAQVEAQRDARVRAYENSLAEERAVIARSRREMQAAAETREKLAAAMPHLREQEQAFERLAREGFAGKLMLQQRTRERIEAEQDVRAQEHKVEGARAAIDQAERRMAQLAANYRAQLRGERVETQNQVTRLAEEGEKLAYRARTAELRAPADGVIKDLATHTQGSVLAPGSVLMTLVPSDGRLVAEVWLQNRDAGFVREGQPARLKLAAYPFQKHGMLDGRVLRISADATERGREAGREAGYAYRALVELPASSRFALQPGMQLAAEIRTDERSVLEYFLSPIQKAAHEAGRER